MLTSSLLLALLAQTDPVAPPATEAPKQEFSETFKRRRAWEKEQEKPSWMDHLAFAIAAHGSGGFFSDPALPAPVAPGISMDLELGGHFTPAVSLVGLAEVRAAFLTAGSEVFTTGLGAGLRLGSTHHITIGAGYTYDVYVKTVTIQSTRIFAPIVELRGVIVLTGKFGIHLRAGMIFAPMSVIADLGVGVGLSI